MGKPITVTLWDDTWQALEAMLKAHGEWLEVAKRDDPNLKGLGPWDAETAINSVLRQYLPTETGHYRYSTEAIKRALAESEGGA